MDKSTLKKKLKLFYTQLSIFRKNKRLSKSMNLCFSSSENKIKEIVNTIDLAKKSIADIGGADGNFIFGLAEKGKINDKNSLYLIDISKRYLSKAKEIYDRKFSRKFKFKAICRDIDDLRINNTFDIVLLRDVLEHLYFPGNAIENIKNSIRPGGLFLIATPNKNRLNELVKSLIPERFKHKLKLKFSTDVSGVLKLEKKSGIKEHIHEYSLKELRNLLTKHNLKIINEFQSKIPFIAPSLCDKYSFIFNFERMFIAAAELFGLNHYFGFEHIILSKRIK